MTVGVVFCVLRSGMAVARGGESGDWFLGRCAVPRDTWLFEWAKSDRDLASDSASNTYSEGDWFLGRCAVPRDT